MSEKITDEKTIKECVEFGSIVDTIDKLDNHSLLKYLTFAPVKSFRIFLAYEYLCRNWHPDNHYIDSGDHAIKSYPLFAIIAIVHDLSTELLVNKSSDKPLIEYYDEKLLLSRPDIINMLALMNGNDCKQTKFNDVEEVVDYFNCLSLSRISYKNLGNINSQKNLVTSAIERSLINSDWYANTFETIRSAVLFIERVKLLKRKAPNYFLLIFDELTTYASNLIEKGVIHVYDENQFSLLVETFPQSITFNWKGLTLMERRLVTCPRELAGYLLDFDIDEHTPNRDQILSKYRSKEINRTIDENAINKEDTLMEDITSYFSFDVLKYRDGNHVYYFTYPEFSNILKTKVNPYTNSRLSSNFIIRITCRKIFHDNFNLPCLISEEGLQLFKKGLLLQEDDLLDIDIKQST